jgi:group II intron reverse transcriptase/maturase
MTAILERRGEALSLWARFCEWVTSTENRLYVGWFGVIMIPTLLTAVSVYIIAFVAAPPVDIDGIREPVSGSLLYGNNISAPLCFSFGPKRDDRLNPASSAPGSGWLVTVTPYSAPTEHSMPGKHYKRPVPKDLLECKQKILWLKLICLNRSFGAKATHQRNPGDATLETQFLRAVSCQPAVRYSTRGDLCHGLMMCQRRVKEISEMTMSQSNGTNRKPKEFTNHRRNFVSDYRRMRGTVGSTGVKSMRGHRETELRVTESQRIGKSAVDGELVVPQARVKPVTERGSDESCKAQKNALDGEDSSRQVQTVVKRWVGYEKASRGAKVPRRFAKVTKYAKYKNHVFDKLYQLMLDPTMYDHAYHAIKSNPGMMTPGITPETLSGWSAEEVDRIIKKLRDESFQFARARTKIIPKPSGGERVLKIASPRDKMVQKVMTLILQEIYEPTLSDRSYGHRLDLGPHNALKSIERRYQASRWFIEGDIAQCFDSIDHHNLIGLLRRKIKDERFIRLVWKALRAGVLDEHRVPKGCIIGTPQGSILSPILSNIMLHEFDTYVDGVLVPRYNRGVKRRQTRAYTRAMASSRRHSKTYRASGNPEALVKAKAARKLAQSLPSVDPYDPNFRRLTYIRYADDWLIGFAGPYHEAELIKEACLDRLARMRLTLNLDKTKITKASRGATYLGAVIHVPLNQQRFKAGSRLKSRANLGVRLNAPIRAIIGKFADAGYCDRDGRPKPRMTLYAASKDEIVQIYTAALLSYLNHYSYADNRQRMANSMWSIMRNSCAKVLAAKLKLRTVRQVLKKFGRRLNRGGGSGFMDLRKPIDAFKVRFKLGKRHTRSPLYRSASNVIRLRDARCIDCTSKKHVEMHHVRGLKDLNKRLDLISRVMAARSRKQAPLCRRCHRARHIMLNKLRRRRST